MTFSQWVAAQRDTGKDTDAIAAQFGWSRRTLFRKLKGQGLSARDMQAIHAASGGVVTFDDYVAGVAA